MSIKKLELRKLLLDLNYWKSENEIKRDIISSSDQIFKDNIEQYLKENSDIKKMYDKILDKKASNIQKVIENNYNKIEINEKKVNKIENPLLKKVYRDIVKITHPDKIGSDVGKREKNRRQKVYILATDSYKSNNISDILQYAYDLNIDFELDESNLKVVEKTIENYKKQSSFLEDTISYKWYHSNEKERNKIILNFLNN